MKKVLFLLLFSLFVLLAACGETEGDEADNTGSEEEAQSSQEDADVNEEPESAEGEAEAEEEGTEEEEAVESESSAYNEVLLDDDTAKVVLTGIETKQDDIFGDEHSITFEIENKSDGTIEVQSRELSLDGLMADDMAIFSQTVAAGKRANGELSIMAFDEELPELNENLEFRLVILGEDFMEITSSDVSVDIE
ncbi:hypothetical protein [Oceanobacillus sp. CFH 90083]|uniref:hypothetical protein n=1 Tax=Oceanobacillus sp. CFH 90083 TaxID=2592336 RepID=UPI00128D5EEA|nr:hypothetical protein [Oceanobacillus sp. CFH 90083]